MKIFTISAALAFVAGRVYAVPILAQAIQARQFEAGITFIGVDPSDAFFMSFPTNAQPVTITNPKSISKISSEGGAVCSFFGVDGSNTLVVGKQEVDVGSPQAQVKAVCDSL